MSNEMPLISCLVLRTSIQQKHAQGKGTWSESKLMIGNQAIGEEEGFDVGSNNGFHSHADDWEADWSVVAGISFLHLFYAEQ